MAFPSFPLKPCAQQREVQRFHVDKHSNDIKDIFVFRKLVKVDLLMNLDVYCNNDFPIKFKYGVADIMYTAERFIGNTKELNFLLIVLFETLLSSAKLKHR